MLTLRQKLILVLSGALSALLLVEVVTRLAGFAVVTYREHANNRPEAKQGSYTILCLGESTTAFQYPSFLEKALNERRSDVNFTVIDRGIPSADSTAILAQLPSYLEACKPDMVIAMMGINDGRSDIPYPEEGFWRKFRVYRLLRLLKSHLGVKWHERQGPPAAPPADHDGTQGEEGETKLTRIIKEYSRLCAAKNAPRNEFPADNRSGAHTPKEEREERLVKAIAADPHDISLFRQLGSLYAVMGRNQEAAEVFMKCIRSNVLAGRDLDIYDQLIDTCLRLGLAADALAVVKNLAGTPGHSAYAGLLLALIYERQGNNAQAIEVLGAVRRHSRIDHGMLRRLAGLYQKTGQNGKIPPLLEERAVSDDILLGQCALHYFRQRDYPLAERYFRELEELFMHRYNPVTYSNYRQLVGEVTSRGIRMVCMQYPMRNVKPLKKMIPEKDGVIFVDNERVFKHAVRKHGYRAYFTDQFAGDFGHCNDRGNIVMAENIVGAIMRNVPIRKG